MTDQARENFFTQLVAAAREARTKGEANLSWYEEWCLERVDGSSDGVEVVAVTEAQDVGTMSAEVVTFRLEQALKKFEERRWAELHVIVLDTKVLVFDATFARTAAVKLMERRARAQELVDLVLLVRGTSVVRLWPE